MSDPTPREVFLRLVHGVAEERYGELPDLYAETTDVRHPMATPPARPLTSRDELREHFSGMERASLPRRRVVDVVVHETTDPEVIVAEFGYEFPNGDGPATTVPCVFVMRVRNGEIVESRDYIDPLRTRLARDDIGGLAAALRATRGSGA
ncbi:hypothetical protein Acsp03_12860 [Actinomadura sp. NBRC 104412]|uniref:nuclear transport factor 2 family protein n=1 Tax=Actinomadura sp. NBRC 104412 TaxID=3032203 RepID=UPI0024A384E6|nr:nuclear transport factor 2 family protein [Actinomadura sp. NBRC 104412]GLZ03820.1 hypothetical protein Acsp03_12860 [Actinomadura sp. NBRC 104412]